jgi:prepilin-type N-terminal cleavage/methylation domain-containing protein
MNRKGFTLIELLVCIMILCIMTIMVITVGANVMAWRSADRNSNAVIIQQQQEETVDNSYEPKFSNENRY